MLRLHSIGIGFARPVLSPICPQNWTAVQFRSSRRVESDIGDTVESDNATVVFEKGLGANDYPGHTFLLRVEANEDWWDGLAVRLDLLRAAANGSM